MTDAPPSIQPRGAKLDVKLRADYEQAIQERDCWDTPGWPAWTITGRILPERCDVQISRIACHGISAAGRWQLNLQVVRSQAVAVCKCENRGASIFEIADIVRSALSFPVDYIAFQNRGAYELVLDLCVNHETGETTTVPVNEPILESKRPNFLFDATANESEITIPFAAASQVSYCHP